MKFLFLLVFLVSCAQFPQQRKDKLSILQGVTNSRSVEFSILVPKGVDYRAELRLANGEIISPEETRLVTRDFSRHAVMKVLFNRDPNNEYNLFVFQGDRLIDQRLVGKGQLVPNRLKLAVASCMDDYAKDQFTIWDTLASRNPEYLLMIGDNVYADKTGPSTSAPTDPVALWRRYSDVRLTLPLFYQEKLIPVHAVWDDHDYGINNGGEDFPFKDASREVFETFFAQALSDDDWNRGEGIGGVLTLGDFNLYFLDNRSFRSADKAGKHLGVEQEKWLLDRLAEENSPSFLIKGDQFFGGYHRFESFQGSHPEDFDKFIAALNKVPAPFVFVSGDRHMSEVMQFPRPLFARPSFEITSSPIHARMYPDSVDSNPWRVVSNQSKVNFTMISNEARQDHWFMDVENIAMDGETIYRRELAVFIRDLQNNLDEVRKRRQGKRRYNRRYYRR